MRRFLILLLIPMLSGCAATVTLDAAEDSNNPLCAEVMVRLPDQIAEFPQRYTNAQATSAWGEPVSLIIRCGLKEVTVSELPCVTAGEVDWLVDDSQAPSYRFISYARNPAIEVVVDSTKISGVTSLEALSSAVSQIPAQKTCTAIN